MKLHGSGQPAEQSSTAAKSEEKLILKTQSRGASENTHANHLVQQAALGLGEAGHMEGEGRL